ncbi:YebO family protein [Proteus mirabilis]|nr:hypothetical protein [Proteus mirabilis]
MGTLLLVNIIILIISVIIWFFLNRSSVRANRVVELLESIEEKHSRQIELLLSVIEYSTSTLSSEDKIIKDYFYEAKIISENLISSDGRLNEENIIKFAKLGNKYIEKEKLTNKNINDSIDLFTMLKNEKFSKLSKKEQDIANNLYKENVHFL